MNTALIDSRLVAQSLGVEHESFIRILRTHQTKLEELGIFRFQIGKIGGRGRPETFALLNEDQAIFAATLSRNTSQVVNFKLKLTKAFSVARKQQTSLLTINHLWQKRLALFNERTRIPDGYWCVFNEIAAVCWSLEFQGAHLREDAVPDISVGQMWCKHARHLGLDLSLVRQYPHHYPDRRGVQAANIYPNAWLGAFRDWFQTHYLKHHFPAYLKAHALALPSPEPRR